MEFRLQPLGFMEFFFFQNNNHQAVRKMNKSKIENRKSTVKNRSDFVGMCDCKCVSV